MNRSFVFKAALIAVFLINSGSSFSRDELTEYTPADSVPVDTVLTDRTAVPRYTFKAVNTGLLRALTMFAKSNGFTLDVRCTVKEKTSVAFENKSIEESLNLFFSNTPYSWALTGNEISISEKDSPFADLSETVKKLPAETQKPLPLTVIENGEERLFKINYPRLKRKGSGSSAASFSSSSSGESGTIQLSTEDELVFWKELEEQLRQLLSTNGKLVINHLAGIIHVRDTPQVLKTIHLFLEEVVPAATRQVEITARIYEVTLNDDKSLGINWDAVYNDLEFKGKPLNFDIHSTAIQTNPSYKTSTINLDLSYDNQFLNALLSAMKEQGEVRAVSQPRVVTLNNQPALVKVGTDMPFFSATVTTNNTTGIREVQEEVNIITVGVILSVTPQISEDGWITLGIDPLISDLVTTLTSATGSTAPVVDVKQSSTVARIKDRETVRISGLMHTKETKIHRKIPLLGDVPVVGRLFNWSYEKKDRKELVIFITPRVLW
jgi:MSHA type pilus biogenesis protein MshL